MKAQILFGTLGIALLTASPGCSRDDRRRQLLAKANQFYQQQKYADASLIYRKALQVDPNSGEAHYGLGRTQMGLKHYSEARVALDRAVELMPDNEDASAQAGELYLLSYLEIPTREAYDHAESISKRLLAHDPKSFAGLRLQGYLAVVDAKPAKAIEFFTKANAVKPGVLDVASALAQSLIMEDRGDEAERVAKELIAAHSDYGPIYDTLYGYYVQMGRLADAEQVLSTKVRNNPNNDFPVVQLAEHYWRNNQPAKAERTIHQVLETPEIFPRPYLAAADFYKHTGNWSEAVRALEAGAAASANEKGVYEKYAVEALLQGGKKAEAVNQLNRLLRESPKDDDLRGARATLLVDSSNPEERSLATRDLVGLVQRSPNNVTFRYQLGRVYAADGRYPDARQQFAGVAAIQPAHFMAKLGLAELASKTGDFLDCLRYVEEAIALQPGVPSAHLLRGTALVGLGNFDEARLEFKRLVTANPKYREAQLQLALLNVVQGRYQEAEKGFRDNYDPDRGDFRALKGLVEIDFAQGQPDQAFALLQKESARHPGSELRSLTATTAARAGKWDLAAREYERLRDEHPQDAAIQLALGDAYQQLGELPKAAGAFQRAQALRPDDWRPPFLLGYLHQLGGQSQEAQADYRNCLRLNPNQPEALNNLAFLLAEEGFHLDEALALARRAAQADHGNSRIADTVGWIYLKQGHLDAAQQVFAGLVRKNPRDGMLRYHLGLALDRMGARSDARKELRAALEAGLPPAEKSTAAQVLSRN